MVLSVEVPVTSIVMSADVVSFPPACDALMPALPFAALLIATPSTSMVMESVDVLASSQWMGSPARVLSQLSS